jgi:hypothetical protein
MNFCLRSFAIAVLLLHTCGLSDDVQLYDFHPGHACSSWADAASGEEDSRELEDDDLAGHAVIILGGEPIGCPVADLEFLRFEDHVQEMILPPPLA